MYIYNDNQLHSNSQTKHNPTLKFHQSFPPNPNSIQPPNPTHPKPETFRNVHII